MRVVYIDFILFFIFIFSFFYVIFCFFWFLVCLIRCTHKLNYWIVTCYFFPGWGWYLTEAEAELKIVFNWTTIFQRSVYESSITSLEMIDDPSPDFEAGSSTTQHKLFKQKVVYREDFSSRWLIEDKIFFVIDNEKEIVDH